MSTNELLRRLVVFSWHSAPLNAKLFAMRSILASLLLSFGRLLTWRHFQKLFFTGLAALVLGLLVWWSSSRASNSLSRQSPDPQPPQESLNHNNPQQPTAPPQATQPRQTIPAPQSQPQISLRGRVVGISDGDTLTLLTQNRQQVKIRLHGIDAPELGQPWGRRAKQALSSLTFRQIVSVQETDQDRYGRIVGIVYRNQHSINEALIASGHAWVYRKYNKNKRWNTLETEARKRRRGLWNLQTNQRIPPWDYRRRNGGRH